MTPRLLAHGTASVPDSVLGAWTLDPLAIVAVLVAVAGYWHGARSVGPAAKPSRVRILCFAAGIAATAAALLSPVHELGLQLYSVHMLQHLLLVVVAAPLLVAGTPLPVLLSALPRRGRRTVSAYRRRAAGLRPFFRSGAWPLAVWSVHAVTLWVWHLPPAYQAALTNELIHIAEHVTLLGSALLFWWLCLRTPPRMSHGAIVVLLFLASLQGTVLAALITFSSTPWYPVYEATAPAWGLTPLQDQQLAGTLMWMPGSAAYLLGAVGVFWSWMRLAEPARRTLAGVSAGLLVTAAAGCAPQAPEPPDDLPRADVERGGQLAGEYGCGSCHVIPGVAAATGRAAPPLTRFAHREYIAGRVPVTGDTLATWIMDPDGLRPGTAMPDLGVPRRDAEDIAAYLLNLE